MENIITLDIPNKKHNMSKKKCIFNKIYPYRKKQLLQIY